MDSKQSLLNMWSEDQPKSMKKHRNKTSGTTKRVFGQRMWAVKKNKQPRKEADHHVRVSRSANQDNASQQQAMLHEPSK